MARVHEGYIIIQVKKAAGREYLVGYNPEAENPYVCWCCENEKDYFWGFYTKSASEAVDKMNERFEEGLQEYNNQVMKAALEREKRELSAQQIEKAHSSAQQVLNNTNYNKAYNSSNAYSTSIGGWFGWLLLCWLLPLIGPIILACADTNDTAKNYGKLHIIFHLIGLFIFIVNFAKVASFFEFFF